MSFHFLLALSVKFCSENCSLGSVMLIMFVVLSKFNLSATVFGLPKFIMFHIIDALLIVVISWMVNQSNDSIRVEIFVFLGNPDVHLAVQSREENNIKHFLESKASAKIILIFLLPLQSRSLHSGRFSKGKMYSLFNLFSSEKCWANCS